jgi:beta-galactosidase
VEEYYALHEPVPVAGKLINGVSQLWAERLKILDPAKVTVAAHYGPCNGWLDGQAAITVNGFGTGLIHYVGAYLDQDAQQSFTDQISRLADVRPVLQTPAGVGAGLRVNPAGERVYIVVNHTRDEKPVSLPWSAHEHLRGQPLTGELRLPPYGVALLTRTAQR